MQILIDDILEQKNKTRYWLAKEIEMSYSNLCNLANNQTSSIRFDFLEKICMVLDCTPNDILKIENSNEN